MATVAITQLQNGTTADALSVDANFNALATQVNGNLDATNIASGAITDTQLSSSISPITGRKEMFSSFVVSGFTVATSVNLSTTIIGGTAYINGKRVVIANTPVTVAASKDTYIDISDTGAVTQVAVANNATSGMTMTLNSDGTNALRIAKLVSSATAIVQSLQNTFNTSPVAPNTANWFGFDPIGNAVYNASPNPTNIGYAHITSDFASSANADITGLNITVIIPVGRKAKISGFIGSGSASAVNNAVVMNLTDVTASATIAIASGATNASGDVVQVSPSGLTTLSGTRNYKAIIGHGANASTSHTNSTPTNPSWISVDLV